MLENLTVFDILEKRKFFAGCLEIERFQGAEMSPQKRGDWCPMKISYKAMMSSKKLDSFFKEEEEE